MDATGDTKSSLSPDQLRFLSAPIFGPALRQDPKAAKGNVYIPGNFVLAQLNTAFCFDGWSFEIAKVERVHMEKYQKDGKDQFKALFMVEGVLTIRCQDGSTFSRAGIGVDEKTSSNMKDVVSLATKAALTDAIKNAAITLGSQFGLDTVRAGNDAGGVKINWKHNASGERPRPPMFSGVSTQLDTDPIDDDGENVTEGGVTYNGRTGEVVQDSRPAGDAGRPQEQQRGRDQDRPQERQEQRREPAPSQGSQSSSQNGSQQGGQGGGGSDQRRETAQSQGSGNGSQSSSNGNGQNGGSIDRESLVKSCREAYRGVMTSNGGAGRAMDIFKRVAQAHGFTGAMPAIGRPQDQGGPTVAFLAEYLRELQNAVG